MDNRSFDTFTRSTSDSISRRGSLFTLGAAGLAALAGSFTVDAKNNDNDKNNDKKRDGKKDRKKAKKKRRNVNQPALQPPPASPPPLPNPAPRADASCAGDVLSTFGFSDGNARLAQTFTALASGTLVRAEVLILKSPGSAGDYILRLSPVDGAGIPTNEVLTETVAPNATVPDGQAAVAFTFANPFTVEAGTQYALVLTRQGSNSLVWVGLTGNVCAGQAFGISNQTSPFVPAANGADLIFTTFVRS